MCALVTQRAWETIKQFYNSRGSQKCCSLVYPFKNTDECYGSYNLLQNSDLRLNVQVKV